MLEFETRAVHAGQEPSQWQHRAIIPPVDLSILDQEVRRNNPTRRCLEESIASLEFAKFALTFPSGLGTITTICQLLEKGDHVIIFDSVYHGTRTYLTICEELGKLEVTFVDLRDPEVLEKHLKENTKMVWLETPCNPTMKLTDIAAISEILKRRNHIILVVDNTFMSPYFQNPLVLGADIVMHSLTKYLNGHSDVLMGAIATNDEALYQRLKDIRNSIGPETCPMDCFLVNRGMKTLHLRMEKHMQNALEIAHFLENHPKVERVFYPGLKSHPQHQLALRQCKGFSGMVSFCVKGGIPEIKKFAENLKLFILAVSLGSPESLIDVSPLMTASALSREKRLQLEIPDNLIRLSIGLESSKDLIADLDQALQNI